MMEPLNLPKFNIPDIKEKKLPPAVFYKLIVQNLQSLHKSGQLDRILKNPTRRPVNVRFSL